MTTAHARGLSIKVWTIRTLICACAIMAMLPPRDLFASDTDNILKKIHHIFVIVLENKTFNRTFGPESPALYLAKQLPSEGALLENYYAIGHFSLPNYIAMISGQAPNPDTQDDCESYNDFSGAEITQDGQAKGRGCVYPPNIKTIADQIEEAKLNWKAYMEDLGNDPTRENACGQPKVDTQWKDLTHLTQNLEQVDEYVPWHNPFVYFHSIVGGYHIEKPNIPPSLDDATCANSIVSLARLKNDLRWATTTPNLAFIGPNLCHDGHDEPCLGGEAPGGLLSADAFLRQVVPQILASDAYQNDGGLLIVTFDETDIDATWDSTGNLTSLSGDDAFSACCGELAGPNLDDTSKVSGISDQGPGIKGPGGG
jgi:phosphatidylinositol-3-phosphatase